MLYCGYQGVGKSTYCRNNPNTTVDLDSSSFKKVDGWEREYIATALSLSATKKVFISAHQAVIEYLMANHIEFMILIPDATKEEWEARLEYRYKKNPIFANLKAIHDFNLHYERDMLYYNSVNKKAGIPLKKVRARITTNIDELV